MSFNATETFLGPAAGRAAARCSLYDIQGLWGGQALYVWGGGRALLRRVSRGRQEERFDASLPPDEINRLWAAFIAEDLAALEIETRPGIPDEAYPVICLYNPAGGKLARGKWARQVAPGFDRLLAALNSAATLAAGGRLVYTGDADWDFRPWPE